jgi:hypothetical protein
MERKAGVAIKMVESIIKVATGSTSNRIDAYNIKNNSIPRNIYFLGLDGWTAQHRQYKEIGNPRIASITLANYGMGGMSFKTQLLAKTLQPKIEEKLLKIEEIANENGNTIKTLYASLFGTGTSASTTPIIASSSRAAGINSLIFAVIPNVLSEGYQTLNILYALALTATSPVILVNEDFAESCCMNTRIMAQNAASMDPSKYYVNGQFSFEYCIRLSRIISGMPENNNNEVKDDGDDLDFLDSNETNLRNMSVELESALGRRAELFTLYYGHSTSNDFQELAILRPSVMPSDPQDPIIFAEFDAGLVSEDEVANAIMTSLEMQGLRPERIFFSASSKNSIIALVPTALPNRIHELIRQVEHDKPLKDVLVKIAKKSLLSNVPPIRIGNENRIVKEGLEKIFFPEKSDVESYVKSLGLAMSWDELAERNLMVNLAEKHDCYIRPVGDAS